MTRPRGAATVRLGLACALVLGLLGVAAPAGAAARRAHAAVVVLARPHAVRATAASRGPATARLRVSGKVTPAGPGRVVLQRRRSKGWLDVGRASVNVRGLYVVSSDGLPVGRWTLRVVEAASRGHGAVAGAPFSVSILSPRPAVAQPTVRPAPPAVPQPHVAPQPAPPSPAGPALPRAGTPIVCQSQQPLPASPGQLAISYVVSPLGYVGTHFGTEVWATGGVAPYEVASSLPDDEGLFVPGGRLDNAYYGGVVVQGVPRAAGVFHYAITVTDDAGNKATSDICLQFAQPLRVATPSLPAATAGVPYSSPLTTEGGFAPVLLFTQSDVSRNQGLYVHDGNLTGTPSNPTISSVPVTAVDGAGGTYTAWATLTVGPLPQPRTLHVPGDSATISAALAQASPGDTVLVEPGTYRENLDYAGKAVIVRSTGGPASTVIEGTNTSPIVAFDHQEPPQAVLAGFTVRPRQPLPVQDAAWIGVRVAGASPTIEDDVIGGGTAIPGSGVAVQGGAPLLREDTIGGTVGTANELGGDGVVVQGPSQVTLLDNVISGNGFGVTLDAAQSVSMQGNLVTLNQYGALWSAATDLRSVDDAFVLNDTRGAIAPGNNPIAVDVSTWVGHRASLVNDTIADNGLGAPLRTQQGTSVRDSVVEATNYLTDMVRCDGLVMAPDYANNVFWHTDPRDRQLDAECIRDVPGNRTADPGFRDRGTGDFSPGRGSTLVDAADPSATLPAVDQAGNPRVVDGNGDGDAQADIGAYERQ